MVAIVIIAGSVLLCAETEPLLGVALTVGAAIYVDILRFLSSVVTRLTDDESCLGVVVERMRFASVCGDGATPPFLCIVRETAMGGLTCFRTSGMG